MSEPGAERFDADWLALREPADLAARATALLDPLRAHLELAAQAPLDVLDLGSGSGATARWLAPLLGGLQRWVLLDRDPDLLARAVARTAGLRAATGDLVEVRTQAGDLTELRAGDLAGTALLTASALLDLLTRAEIDALAAACADARCAALLTLSVAGRVALDPPDPLDSAVAAAFDAHQRRTSGRRALLGPLAVDVAAGAFRERGYVVRTAASPWRLGPESAALARAWLDGWLAAAEAQQPDLTPALGGYRDRRAKEITAGRLHVEVHHRDLLARPVLNPGGTTR